MAETKSAQLQIRISPSRKAEIVRQAQAAGMSVSAWILAKALPPKRKVFQRLMEDLAQGENTSATLAALNDLICSVDGGEFAAVFGQSPSAMLSAWQAAYVASMIEHGASLRHIRVPVWAREAPPLASPYFATELLSLRIHLLTHSPPAFRRRNIFVDATVGDRV